MLVKMYYFDIDFVFNVAKYVYYISSVWCVTSSVVEAMEVARR